MDFIERDADVCDVLNVRTPSNVLLYFPYFQYPSYSTSNSKSVGTFLCPYGKENQKIGSQEETYSLPVSTSSYWKSRVGKKLAKFFVYFFWIMIIEVTVRRDILWRRDCSVYQSTVDTR
jgi:hypothetical protein